MEMGELIKALTRAANAVAEYYEKEVQMELPLEVDGVNGRRILNAPEPEAVVPERKKRGPNKPKEEKSVDAVSVSVTPPPAAPTPSVAEMTEEQSSKEIKEVARAFTKRFANQMDGVTAFRKLMVDTCKAGKLDDLVHAQRLQLISVVKAEIAKADGKGGAAPTAASGVEV